MRPSARASRSKARKAISLAREGSEAETSIARMSANRGLWRPALHVSGSRQKA